MLASMNFRYSIHRGGRRNIGVGCSEIQVQRYFDYCRIKHNHLVSRTVLNYNLCEPMKGIPKWNASIPKQHKLDAVLLRKSIFTSTS